MTILKRKVTRETTIKADHHGRHIVIELDPGPPCVIRFREKGRHAAIDAPIGWLYFQAVKADADRKIRARKKEKELRQKARRGFLHL